MAACATCGYYPAVYFNACPEGECRVCTNWRKRHDGQRRPAEAVADHGHRLTERDVERASMGLPPLGHNKTWHAEPKRRNRRVLDKRATA